VTQSLIAIALVVAGWSVFAKGLRRWHLTAPIILVLNMAVPPVIKALVVGVVVGATLALLTNAAERRDLMTEQSKRLLIVVAPILSYGISIGIEGNGFVAAFVCGIAMNALRRQETFHQQLSSTEDIGFGSRPGCGLSSAA
jgi:sodium/hydrogen antiporter